MEFPTYLYKENAKGEIEQRLFEHGPIPFGWSDSPKSARAANKSQPTKHVGVFEKLKGGWF